jgi:hypothetical protein
VPLDLTPSGFCTCPCLMGRGARQREPVHNCDIYEQTMSVVALPPAANDGRLTRFVRLAIGAVGSPSLSLIVHNWMGGIGKTPPERAGLCLLGWQNMSGAAASTQPMSNR